MPSWEKHIQVDPEGKFTIYGYGGAVVKDQTFNILVPGPRNPDFKAAPGNVYGDLGLRKDGDSWVIMGDRAGMSGIKNLEEQLKGELMRMKARAWAKMRGAQVFRDIDNEDETYVDISMDAEDAKHLMAQAH